MKGRKSFFKLYHLQPSITETSYCQLEMHVSIEQDVAGLSSQKDVYTLQNAKSYLFFFYNINFRF